ncbi:MAG: glycosyltransferase [Planctomycetes bacterium]|nr:glycosyltransferase [Planctomycetota bacterium]
MARQPRISVIMPSFNHAPFIERAICSVLDQGYDNLELVIADGGSADGSLALIDRYADELEWWTSVPDESPAAAVNRALRNITGELVTIVHANDVLLPFALHRVADFCRSMRMPTWIAGGATLIDASDRVIERIEAQEPVSLANYVMGGDYLIPATASFYRADAFEQYGVFDASLLHAYRYDFHCRLLSGGAEPMILSAALAGQRRHSGSLSSLDGVGCGRERQRVTMQYAASTVMAASGRERRAA